MTIPAWSGEHDNVARVVAQGRSNAEIGRELHMSETTIKTYMSRILSKLRCSNRVQAALMVPTRKDDHG